MHVQNFLSFMELTEMDLSGQTFLIIQIKLVKLSVKFIVIVLESSPSF